MLKRWLWISSTLLASWCWQACTSDGPNVIASNCDDPASCVTKSALKIDSVDILLVVDDSRSITPEVTALKTELPRLLTAITNGESGDVSFPPAKSVHVAVTTTDLGVGRDFGNCTPTGRDGAFLRPGEVGVSCEQSYPGYLAYEGGPATVATVDDVSCVPLVFGSGEPDGCGFEQPLEAGLKALWPSTRSGLTFVSGTGHGDTYNAGFLRDDSLLVVVIVTDEDDCSTATNDIFIPVTEAPERELANQPIQLRCYLNKDKLRDPARYVDSLKALRPLNDNVVFAVIAGVPADLTAEAFRANYDFDNPSRAAAYYDDVLADPRMQEIVVDPGLSELDNLAPSCTYDRDGEVQQAMPPRRLVEVARGFGANAVLGSLCSADFGTTTGRLVHTIGERLSQKADR